MILYGGIVFLLFIAGSYLYEKFGQRTQDDDRPSLTSFFKKGDDAAPKTEYSTLSEMPSNGNEKKRETVTEDFEDEDEEI